MAIDNFTSFLGQEVSFICHPQIKGYHALDDLHLLVSGVIEKMIISPDPLKCEIFVNGEWYSMPSVDFISYLDNPSHV